MATQIAIRRDTAANWASANPILAKGEPGYDETNDIFKVGDGVTHWADLAGISGATGGTPTPPPVNNGVTSIVANGGALKTGAVTLQVSDISDVSQLGSQLLTTPDPGSARAALGVTSLFGNTVTISGATATRTDPTTGNPLPLPPQCTVWWISATAPANLVTGDFWVNDPNV